MKNDLEVVDYDVQKNGFQNVANYDKSRYVGSANEYKKKVTSNAYKKLIGPLDSKLVLDVGCGTGRGLADFAGAASLVIGADASEDMLKLAASKIVHVTVYQNNALVTREVEVPEGQAVYFHYPGPDDQAMLLHLPGGRFVAYSQKCTHLSCAVYYQPNRARLFCPCHDGVYDPESGEPVAGPPQRRLPRIALRQQGNQIYAVAEVP